MPTYETMLVTSATLDEDASTALVGKFRGLIEANATIDAVEVWGKRRLAYPINKEEDGVYTLIHFTGPADFPAELGRVYSITDGVLRSLIIAKTEEMEAARIESAAKAAAAREAAAERAVAAAKAAQTQAEQAAETPEAQAEKPTAKASAEPEPAPLTDVPPAEQAAETPEAQAEKPAEEAEAEQMPALLTEEPPAEDGPDEKEAEEPKQDTEA
jgi:small subunit ribosomal protein S6